MSPSFLRADSQRGAADRVDRSIYFLFLKSSNPVVLLQLVDSFVGYCAPHFEQYFAFARQDFAVQLLQNMAASEELWGAITQSWSSSPPRFCCLLPFRFAVPFSFLFAFCYFVRVFFFICVFIFCLRFLLKGLCHGIFELFWASTKLPLKWKKPENNTLQR